MTRSPWKYRKYQLVVDLVAIPDALVRLVTLRYVDPGWLQDTLRWSFTQIGKRRRAEGIWPPEHNEEAA